MKNIWFLIALCVALGSCMRTSEPSLGSVNKEHVTSLVAEFSLGPEDQYPDTMYVSEGMVIFSPTDSTLMFNLNDACMIVNTNGNIIAVGDSQKNIWIDDGEIYGKAVSGTQVFKVKRTKARIMTEQTMSSLQPLLE